MPNAIVMKLSIKSNPQLGYVRPIIIEPDDEHPRSSLMSDFPNSNSIFITSGYEEYIDKRFSEGDLFRIPYYENSQINSELDPQHSNFCYYTARGMDSSFLSKDEYFHIVKADIAPNKRNVSFSSKPKRYVLIFDQKANTLCGPFDYEDLQFDSASSTYLTQLKPLTYISGISTENQWCIANFKVDQAQLLIDQSIAIIKLSDISNIEYHLEDFILDEQLIKWANELLSSQSTKLSKKDIQDFKEAINSVPTASSNSFVENRLNRTKQLLDKTDYFISQKSQLIENFINSEPGKKYVFDFLDVNNEKVLDIAHERVKKDLQNKYGNLEESRIQLQKENIDLKTQNDNLINQIKESKEELEKKKVTELTTKIQNLENEIKEKEASLKHIIDDLKLGNDIENLNNEVYRLRKNKKEKEKDVDDLNKSITDLKTTRDQIKADVLASNEQLRQKLRDLKPYIDLLNGYIPEPIAKREFNVIPAQIESKQPNNLDEMSSLICERLLKFDRKVDKIDCANYLVSSYQNFVTIYAGPPGTGKTSLVTYLATALGLCQDESERFLHISTARGWTSQRDLIGFYNSLSSRFQPASNGFYSLLTHVSSENPNDSQLPPVWVLLDEANLSPMEHYWSSFMLMCDNNNNRIINTGDQEHNVNIQIPAYLRFLATVNFDHTTERLSPRIIDRAAIILLSPTNIIANPHTNQQTDGIQFNAITNNSLEKIFHSNEEALTDDEDRLLRNIITTLQTTDYQKYSNPVVISPRKQIQIRKYCSVARDVMKSRFDMCAMDYAIAQYILPMVNGSGDSYRKRLVDFKNVITSLELSQRILDRIICVGDFEHGYYQFFC